MHAAAQRLSATAHAPVVARRESLQLWRERTLGVTGLLSCLLFAFAAFSGMRARDAQVDAHRALAEEDQERFEALHAELLGIPPDEVGGALLYGAADPVAASAGTAEHALKPPASYAFLSVGQSEQYPSFFRVRYDALELINDREVFDNPEITMDGRFDVVFVVIFLVPLFVIVFSFNLISQEKELGVWRMSLAQPVAPGRLVVAKLGSRLFWLAVIVLGPLATALALGGEDLNEPSRWLTAAIVVLGVFLYMAFWLGVATLFNLIGSNSAANATACVFAWLAIVLALPAALQFTGRIVHPTPSRAVLVAAQQATWDHTFSEGREELARRRVRNGYSGGPEPDREIPDEWGYIFIFHRAFEEDMASLYAEHDRAEASIARWQQLTGWISPATAVNNLLESAAGGDYDRHAAFLSQARRFHREFNAFFLPKIYSGDRLRAADYEAIPRSFDWVEPSLGAQLRTPMAMIGALILMNAAVCLGTVTAYRAVRARIAF